MLAKYKKRSPQWRNQTIMPLFSFEELNDLVEYNACYLLLLENFFAIIQQIGTMFAIPFNFPLDSAVVLISLGNQRKFTFACNHARRPRSV